MKGVHAKGARRTWVADDIDAALKATAGITGDAAGDQGAPASSSFGPVTWVVACLGASVFTIGMVRRSRRGRASGQVSS